MDGSLSLEKYAINYGMLEGYNNTIKVIKRMAYGFRDVACFFRKLRASLPGIPE